MYNFSWHFIRKCTSVSLITRRISFEGSDNGVLREKLGAEMLEVTGGWRKLRNKELRDLY
jgi:hypothetical protein